MVVYNIPALSGVKLTLDQIDTLVTLPGVGALKQTSGDLIRWSRSVVNILILCSITVTTKSSPLVCWRALMVVSVVPTTSYGLALSGDR